MSGGTYQVILCERGYARLRRTRGHAGYCGDSVVSNGRTCRLFADPRHGTGRARQVAANGAGGGGGGGGMVD